MKSIKAIKIAEELKKQFNLDNLRDNPVMVAAEELGNDNVLHAVASTLVKIDNIVKDALAFLNDVSNVYGDQLELSDVDSFAAVATEFDKSGDELLQKQASVLDQLLINFSQLSGTAKHAAQEKEIETLIEKYRSERRDFLYHPKKNTKATETIKAIQKQVKEYRPLETSLSTRTCPDHPGAQVHRIDFTVQCDLDKKIYNYKEGFTLMNGNRVPGTSVEGQSELFNDRPIEQMNFTTRENVNK